jgi:Ca2+-binding EF-hand superfamily protein
MDKNKDGKLSKAEIKGPLKNDFSKVDLNEDGYINEEEFKKAPKPKRPGGANRNQQ